ncbi:MAG: hypothetical protein KA536_11585 [Saprospiraceae bacterium]|nr:hypothetical protein [Saprospiraceae bacterium]
MTYYIDNPEINKQEITGIEIISPKSFLGKKIDVSDNIIVLCELNIDKNGHSLNRSEFYGIKFVQELRRKKYKNKVLFVSFLPLGYFRDTKSIYLDLLQFAGHYYLQLPAKPEDYKQSLNQIDILGELSLYDLIHHFCGIREIFDEKLHSVNSSFLNPAADIESLRIKSKEILDSLYKELGKENAVNDTFFNSVSTGEELLEKLKSTVYCETGETDDINTSVTPEWPWKILWLDDEDNSKTLLYHELRQRLGSENKILCCKTYKEAEIAWEKDKAYGEIAVVLCDYRLKDSNGNISPQQGYDFITYIANDLRFCGKIVYSGLKRKFLIESFRHYGIMVNAYSKIDFNSDVEKHVKYLGDEIVRIGDESWITANNSPTGEEWKKMTHTYHKFKSGFEFYNFERSISRQVKQNLDIFIKEFNECDDLNAAKKLTFKDELDLINSKWPSTSAKQFEHLMGILLGRRILIGIYAFLKSNLNTKDYLSDQKNYLSYVRLIFCNIITPEKGNDLKALDWSELKKNDTLKQYTGIHALKLDTSWPLGLLPEEYGWLQFEMELFDYLTEEVKEHIKLINKLRNCLKYSFPLISAKLDENGTLELEKLNKGGKLKESDKALSHKIYFDDENRPLIKTADEIRQVVLYLYNNLDIEKETEFKIFIELWRSLLFTIPNKKSSLGDTASLRNFLLKLKPKLNGEVLSAIFKAVNKESIFITNFTIEDEYILLYCPFEIYFQRNERIIPNFYENKKELFEFYEKALCAEDDSSWITSYKSGLYHFVKYKLKNLNEDDLDGYNLHPFSEISTFKSYSDIIERNRLIYKTIIINKREVNKAYSKIYNELRNTKDESGGSASIITSSIFALDIVNKLKELIENWDDDFPGNDDVLGSLNLEDRDKKKVLTQLKIEPEIQGKNYIVMIQAESFQPVAIYNDTEEIIGYKEYKIKDTSKNISSNDNFIIFAWD